MPRLGGPFKVLEQIGPNAYKVDLLGEYGVFTTFNMVDLSPYYTKSCELPSLRANSFQEGEVDGNPDTKGSSPTGRLENKCPSLAKV